MCIGVKTLGEGGGGRVGGVVSLCAGHILHRARGARPFRRAAAIWAAPLERVPTAGAAWGRCNRVQQRREHTCEIERVVEPRAVEARKSGNSGPIWSEDECRRVGACGVMGERPSGSVA